MLSNYTDNHEAKSKRQRHFHLKFSEDSLCFSVDVLKGFTRSVLLLIQIHFGGLDFYFRIICNGSKDFRNWFLAATVLIEDGAGRHSSQQVTGATVSQARWVHCMHHFQTQGPYALAPVGLSFYLL